MAQILDPLPANSPNGVLCCYANVTSKVQVARITNIPNWYFERVVFPGQRLVFEAMPDAVLEIHTGMMASAILSDKICCESLRLNEEPQNEVLPSQKQQQEERDRNIKRQEIKKNLERTAPLKTSVLAGVS